MAEIDEKIEGLSDELEAAVSKRTAAQKAMIEAGEALKDNKSPDAAVIAQLSTEYARTSSVVADLNKRVDALKEKIAAVTKVKEEGEQAKNSIINVEQLCGNIRAAMKDKGIKIGQLESDAQVQPGYLSRIEKNPGKTTPSLEFVYTASKELDTSIDFLVDGHYDSLTDTEKYVLGFMKKMEDETNQDRLYWNIDLADKILSVFDPNSPEIYPFTQWEADYNGYFDFHIPVDGQFTPSGRSYHCQLTGTPNEVYLMSLQRKYGESGSEQIEQGYALYITKKHQSGNGIRWDESLIANTFLTNDEIRRVLTDFYQVVEKTSTHIHFDSATKNAIEAFMTGKNMSDEVSDDDLPEITVDDIAEAMSHKGDDLPF